MSVRRENVGWRIWIRWVLVSTVGFGAGTDLAGDRRDGIDQRQELVDIMYVRRGQFDYHWNPIPAGQDVMLRAWSRSIRRVVFELSVDTQVDVKSGGGSIVDGLVWDDEPPIGTLEWLPR